MLDNIIGFMPSPSISRFPGNTPFPWRPHLLHKLRTDVEQYYTEGDWIVHSSQKRRLIFGYHLTTLPSSKTHTKVSWEKVILEYRLLEVAFTCLVFRLATMLEAHSVSPGGVHCSSWVSILGPPLSCVLTHHLTIFSPASISSTGSRVPWGQEHVFLFPASSTVLSK